MRTVSRWVLVAAVAFAVAGVTSAQENRRRRPGGGEGGQPPAGGGGFGGRMMSGNVGMAMLLANEGVQKELKLTDDQKTKIKEFGDAQRAKMREAFGGGQFDREKMQELAKEASAATDKFVKETLKEDQHKRIKQINYQVQLQLQGPGAFSNEDVQKSLKLTDDQKDKLKGLSDEMRKDREELSRDLRGANADAQAEARKKLTAVTKDYTTKATEVLTADQKSTWKELTGEPFEIKMDAPQGGRRPGGEGGGDTPRRRPGGGDNPPRGGNRPPRNDNPPPA